MAICEAEIVSFYERLPSEQVDFLCLGQDL